MIQSPLNYTGGKYKLLPQILPLFPDDINTFVDLFCGGCNVGINTPANRHIYNDNCSELIGLFEVMQRTDSTEFIKNVDGIIKKYGLSDVKKRGYSFYGCTSDKGLSEYNKEAYFDLRTDYNESVERKDQHYLMLYVLIVYAFNNQLRFNRNNKFNLPPGKRDFNKKMLDKVDTFITKLHSQNVTFTCKEFDEINIDDLGESDFVYADPPYLITCAAYNEQNGWTEYKERSLLKMLDNLNERNIRFALSNVTESKGNKNELLLDWLGKRNYKVSNLDFSYSNSNYHRKNKDSETKEVLITNY